jgi:hypothetical protein
LLGWYLFVEVDYPRWLFEPVTALPGVVASISSNGIP